MGKFGGRKMDDVDPVVAEFRRRMKQWTLKYNNKLPVAHFPRAEEVAMTMVKEVTDAA